MLSKSVIGIIPARFQSSRFPGKPLALIRGKSLILRTYERAKQIRGLKHLIVATDDERILHHVQEFGGHAVMTSSTCATGTDRLAEVLSLYPEYQACDYILNIQGDEPLLHPDSAHEVIYALSQDPDACMATAVTPLKDEEEAHLPSVVKCVKDLQGNALYFSRSCIPYYHGQPFQRVWRHIGIYCYTLPFLQLYPGLSPTPLAELENLEQLKVLEHGYRIKVATVKEHPGLGVDLPQDILRVEALLWE